MTKLKTLDGLSIYDTWRVLGYKPNQWAIDHVHGSKARFNSYCTCRQCGKTMALAGELNFHANKPPDEYGPPMVGVLSFDYAHAALSIDRWRQWMTNVGLPFKQNTNEHTIWLPWNGNAQVRWLSSAEDPYRVAGYTWSAFFIDEAQKVPDDVYHKLRPGLDVRDAPLYSFGTPDVIPDQTWFEGLFYRGLMTDQPNYHSFTLPAMQNRWMKPNTIKEAREGNMTEEAFRMLYLGQWIQLDNKVFRRKDVDSADREEELKSPRPGKTYVMGLDVAQTHDYSVVYVGEAETKKIVYKWRKSGLDYTIVEDMAAEIYNKFKCKSVMLEANGPGRPVADHLRKLGCYVIDPFLGNKNKSNYIESLAADLQFGRIALPQGDRQLERELKAYSRKSTPSGNLVYGAPEGYFDDTVIALMYTAHQMRTAGPSVIERYASWGNTLQDIGRRLT